MLLVHAMLIFSLGQDVSVDIFFKKKENSFENVRHTVHALKGGNHDNLM